MRRNKMLDQKDLELEQKEIRTQLSELDYEIENINKYVTELREKIKSILSREKSPKPDNLKENMLSPLGMEINALKYKSIEINHNLNEIISRIEL